MSTLRTTGPVASPSDRKARLSACRECVCCGVALPQLIRRVGYSESVCPLGKWAAVASHVPAPVELPAEVRESLAAESRKMMADAMEDRKAAVANGVRRGKATIRKVADLADKCAACDEAEWGSTEESPGGEVVGCKLITSAVVQGHCLSCPKKWKTAVESGIPPVGCKWRVEGGPT